MPVTHAGQNPESKCRFVGESENVDEGSKSQEAREVRAHGKFTEWMSLLRHTAQFLYILASSFKGHRLDKEQ